MTILRALPAPTGATLDEVQAAVLKLPATDFDRIAPENPVVLKYGDADASNGLTVGDDAAKRERETVVKIVAGFLVLLWVATRKRTF